MGACPYCRSATLPGDTICYSCGRVLPTGDRESYRLEQQFSKNKKDKQTTYRMAAKPSQRGVVQTHTGRQRNIMKRKKNRFRSVAMLGLVAFVMLSPQAQEAVFGEFGGVDEFLQSQLAPYHIYPNEASYTLSKTYEHVKEFGSGQGTENILIPPTYMSSLSGQDQFVVQGEDEPYEPTVLQQTLQITVAIDGQEINVPVDGMPHRSYQNALSTPSGYEVGWPEVGAGEERCPLAKCVKVRTQFTDGGTVSFAFNIRVQSTSYSWWDDGRVDARIAGKNIGINMENSGTFEDLTRRGNGVRLAEFGGDTWYNNDRPDYAIDGQNALVMSTADTIATSLPEGSTDNAYAFARATFDYHHTYVSYDREAPEPPRSGPTCLEAGTGDCDEQTNAYFSILRTRGVPGWYAFGVLGDPYFSNDGWEGHAWGYIQLPLSETWCEERNIVLQTCFVEAQVDVVNNKWLLSTPTAYIDWVEQADPSGEAVYDYYHPFDRSWGPGTDPVQKNRDFETIDSVELNGGTYKVKKYAETL